MRKLLAALLCVIAAASPALAAITSVGTLTATPGVSASSSASVAATTSAQCDAGNICMCWIAFDNITTTDTNSTNLSSVTDSGSNTWTIAREFTNGNGTAATGATAALAFTKATTNIASSGTITANFSGSIVAKAISCWEFAVDSGNSIRVAGTPQDLASDADADPDSMAISGLSSKEYLFVRVLAKEYRGASFTVTASFTEITEGTADGGSGSDSMSAAGEFQILTGTGATSDPTIGGNAGDEANMFIAFEEYTPAAVTCRGSLSMLGVGGC